MNRFASFVLTVGLGAGAAAGIALLRSSATPGDAAATSTATDDGHRTPGSALHGARAAPEPAQQANAGGPAAPKPALQAKAGARPRTIHLSGLDNMSFTDTTIEARPGELIEVELHTIGAQPADVLKHNFVLLDRGVSVDGFIRVAALARDTGYLPTSFERQIIAATNLAAASETVTTTFRAPTAPGQYPFVCSYPSHFAAGMKGTLIVK